MCVCVAEVKCTSEKSNKQLVSAEQRNQLWLEGAFTFTFSELHLRRYFMRLYAGPKRDSAFPGYTVLILILNSVCRHMVDGRNSI